MSELTDKIKSRGYWSVRVRPCKFKGSTIGNIAELLPLVRRLAVPVRGWEFPRIGQDIRYDTDWIGGETDWRDHLESWRVFMSGQFVFLGAMRTDWREQAVITVGHPRPVNDTRWLGIDDALYFLASVVEFTRRLVLSEVGHATMDLSVTANGLEGRQLMIDSPQGGYLSKNYVASLSRFPMQRSLSQTDLAADRGDIAISMAVDLFQRFGWSAQPLVLQQRLERDWQV